MKDVMISMRPKWCELEATGEKTIEVRKTKPKIETPFKCRIYCTAMKDKKRYSDEFDIPINTRKWLGNGKVIGEFVCDKVEKIECCSEQFNMIAKDACVALKEIMEYCSGKDIYAWHISDLKIYDEPKELSEFDYYNKCVSDCENVDCCKTNAIANECEGYTPCAITRPPQSWCYCEELEENENE